MMLTGSEFGAARFAPPTHLTAATSGPSAGSPLASASALEMVKVAITQLSGSSSRDKNATSADSTLPASTKTAIDALAIAVTFVETGDKATIGERLRAVEPCLQNEDMFLANYGDG